jgi:hypothetical protein
MNKKKRLKNQSHFVPKKHYGSAMQPPALSLSQSSLHATAFEIAWSPTLL